MQLPSLFGDCRGNMSLVIRQRIRNKSLVNESVHISDNGNVHFVCHNLKNCVPLCRKGAGWPHFGPSTVSMSFGANALGLTQDLRDCSMLWKPRKLFHQELIALSKRTCSAEFSSRFCFLHAVLPS